MEEGIKEYIKENTETDTVEKEKEKETFIPLIKPKRIKASKKLLLLRQP